MSHSTHHHTPFFRKSENPFLLSLLYVANDTRKTRDGKQRFAVPNGEFGKCEFLNDVPIEELKSALNTHKEFIKSRFNSGDGKEAYVDAGDLGVDPKKYANGNTNGDSASSLKTNGLDKTEKAAVKAGGVPANGHVVNGVS